MKIIINPFFSATVLAIAFSVIAPTQVALSSPLNRLQKRAEPIVKITNLSPSRLQKYSPTQAKDLLKKLSPLEDVIAQGGETVPESDRQPNRKRNSWYFTISGSWQNREKTTEPDPDSFLTFRSGYGLNAGLGRRLGDIRLEGEFSFFNNDVATASAPVAKQLGFAPAPAEGNVNLKAYMANVYYDIPLNNSPIKPYIGFGVGLYQSQINGVTAGFFAPGGVPPINATSDSAFAYQLRTGIGYELSKDSEVYLGYRYFHGNELEFSAEGLGTFHPQNVQVHNIELGIRALF